MEGADDVDEAEGPSKADLKEFMGTYVSTADLEKTTLRELHAALEERFGTMHAKAFDRARRIATKQIQIAQTRLQEEQENADVEQAEKVAEEKNDTEVGGSVDPANLPAYLTLQ